MRIARRLTSGQPAIPRATLLERDKLISMFGVNRDIMIRTASLIAVFLFFTSQGARAGDVTLAANAVLNNFLLISAFFLDGFANAAEQLCGRAYGARDRPAFSGAVRLVISWGFAFALAVTAVFALFGPLLIDLMTASADVRHGARDYLPFVVVSPLLGVFAFGFDGVYIGATWAREMRNLMMLSLLLFLTAWLALRSFGNAGLWAAFLVHYAARGGLQALRYPAMLRASFRQPNRQASCGKSGHASAICRLRRRVRFRRPIQHLLSRHRRERQFPDRLRRVLAAGPEAARISSATISTSS